MSPEQFYSDEHPPIERIVALVNPLSKNGSRGQRDLGDLVEASELPVDTIQTNYDPNVTADRLLAILEPSDLLFVIGGDGSANSAIEPVMKRQALLLPTRSGNANDLAMSINGRCAPWQIYTDYRLGRIAPTDISPIRVSVEGDAVSEMRYAINYASFGYAALASHYLNQPWAHPPLKRANDFLPALLQNGARLPREGYLLGKAAAQATLFDYRANDDEEFMEAADISFVHSRRMAKLGRFNISHTDPAIFKSVMTKAGVIAVGNQFIKMMLGKVAGENVTGLEFSMVNRADRPLYFQVDGEASPLPDESNICVGLANNSVRVLASRLA